MLSEFQFCAGGVFFLHIICIILFVYFYLTISCYFFGLKEMIKGHCKIPVDSSETCDLLDCEDGNIVRAKERKAKDLKKVKCHLVDYQKLPGYLRDNEYIVGYYRSEWPLKQILLSMFTIHNETLNVWT